MKQLRVGIIGTAHAPAISAVEQTSLVAVLSRNEAKGQAFLQRHSVSGGESDDADYCVDNFSEIERIAR